MAREIRSEVDNSAWDGQAAMSGCLGMDDPAAAFNAICAGKKAGDPATEAAHALPHHKHPGDPPNKAGVSSALGRIGQTDGLTNKAAAQAHLDGHQSAIQGTKAAPPMTRREAGMPCGTARIRAFPSELRAKLVQREGKTFYNVTGYATTFNQLYEMWDMFGPFKEGIRGSALNSSLSNDPDVAFLTNHRGITMARTTNESLVLNKDLHGLGIDSFLNADRQDVRDLASAINDKLITEMSFAFMLLGGEWEWADETGREFDEFWITEADINRGDVSAVNYGANPYTSIEARSQELAELAKDMPVHSVRAFMTQLSARDDADQFLVSGDSLGLAASERYSVRAADLSERARHERDSVETQEKQEEPQKTRKATHTLKSARARFADNTGYNWWKVED